MSSHRYRTKSPAWCTHTQAWGQPLLWGPFVGLYSGVPRHTDRKTWTLSWVQCHKADLLHSHIPSNIHTGPGPDPIRSSGAAWHLGTARVGTLLDIAALAAGPSASLNAGGVLGKEAQRGTLAAVLSAVSNMASSVP